jgi:hypothetical protein
MALIEVIFVQAEIDSQDSYFIKPTKFFHQNDLIILDFDFQSFKPHFNHFIILNFANYFVE